MSTVAARSAAPRGGGGGGRRPRAGAAPPRAGAGAGGRRGRGAPPPAGATVRSVLAGLSARYPELHAALWHGEALGEHIEVLVNDAVLDLHHTLDSPLAPGDRLTLLGQFMGG